MTGLVDPAQMTTNAAGRPGDVLVLTKPLGVGAIVTARKRGAAGDDVLAARRRDDDRAERRRRGRRADGGRARDDRRHRLRAARAPASPGPRERPRGEVDAAAVPAIDGRRGHPERRARRLRRQPPQRRVGRGFHRRRRRRPRLAAAASSPTRRPPAGCSCAADPIAAEALPGPIIGRLGDGPPGTISGAMTSLVHRERPGAGAPNGLQSRRRRACRVGKVRLLRRSVPDRPMSAPLVLGTAGHVDHGKTTLVRP